MKDETHLCLPQPTTVQCMCGSGRELSSLQGSAVSSQSEFEGGRKGRQGSFGSRTEERGNPPPGPVPSILSPPSVPVCSYDESWLRALRTAIQLGGLGTTKILILAREPPPCSEPALPRPLAQRVQSCRRSQGSPPSAFSMLLASRPLRTLSPPFPVDNDCFSLVLYFQVLPTSKVGF